MRILVLSWRDTGHPDGGGSELYVEQLVDGLAGAGHEVTLFTAAYAGAAAREVRDSGVRIVRDGGRFGVYPAAARAYLRGDLSMPEVILEVQNGVPFLSRLWARTPAKVVLTHHVHRAQWMMIFDPVRARIGWAIESQLAPRLNRGLQYVTISAASKAEHVELGIRAADMTVVYAGTDHLQRSTHPRATSPTLISLGRLVPHKRVEWAIDTLADLLPTHPDARLLVVGDGWWADRLRQHATARGVADSVDFHGFVDDATKKRLLATSWLALMPSVKEGWGLVVSEAGIEHTPTVAFATGGGVTEAIDHGRTGVLVDEESQAAFSDAVRRLISDRDTLAEMGAAAAEHASGYTWDATITAFEQILATAVARRSRMSRVHAAARRAPAPASRGRR